MRVIQVFGEPTRFHVESTSLECPKCGKLFPRLSNPKNSHLRVGDECPKCREADLDFRFHLVDVAAFHPVGQCSCEHWNFILGKQVRRMSPKELEGLTQQQARALRCTHIEAARTYAIDLTINQHERQRLGCNLQREEAQP